MDFALTHEQELLVGSARAFVERELYPHEPLVEREREVPRDLAAEIGRKARALGFHAANMPEELGGGGLDPVSLALFERELGRASFALQYVVARPSNILRACVGEQAERWLRPTVRGERVECLALSEPEAGSDLRSMRTTARPAGGGDWVVDGEKHFISHADVADYAILFAATGQDADGRKRLTAFLVDKGTPGFEVRPGYACVSHRGYNNGVLRFAGCRVPAGQVLGEPHRGLALAGTWLASTRLSVAAMCLGRAHRALELATAWAAARRQFGRPIGRFQGTGFKLADMQVDLRQAELLTLWAAWRDARGELRPEDAAMAKLAASEMLGRVADAAVQVHGGMGLMEDLPLERIWRDARVERIWDGTSEIQRHVISRAVLRPLGS